MRVELGPAGPVLFDTPPRRPLGGGHSVRLRIELAGICRSDLKEVAGGRHGPSQFGHEIVARVESSTVDALPVGLRVGLDPNVGVPRGSGFADTMWLSGSVSSLVAALPALPEGVDARKLVFAEPLACAAHCLSTVTRHAFPGRVAVLGAGTAGVLIALLAARAGATVELANRTADRPSPLPVAPFAALGEADVAVVATSYIFPPVLETALATVREDGLVLLYGGTAPGDRLPGLDVDLDPVRRTESCVQTAWHDKPLRVAGSYGTTPADFRTAITALEDLPVEDLITAEIPLHDLPAALIDPRPGKTLVRTT